jgi:hypothetical protein
MMMVAVAAAVAVVVEFVVLMVIVVGYSVNEVVLMYVQESVVVAVHEFQLLFELVLNTVEIY